MSLSDRGVFAALAGTVASRRLARVFALVALLGGLSACTIRPVYMPVSGSQVVGANLSAIAIESAGDRVGQQVRNNLAFAFDGGRTPPPARYLLALAVSTSEVRLGFNTNETSPAYQVTVAAKFELKEIATDRVILRSLTNGVATYDRSNQSFANVRARIDAENRAAQAAADEITLRLAIALAKDKPKLASVTPSGPATVPGAAPTAGPAGNPR